MSPLRINLPTQKTNNNPDPVLSTSRLLPPNDAFDAIRALCDRDKKYYSGVNGVNTGAWPSVYSQARNQFVDYFDKLNDLVGGSQQISETAIALADQYLALPRKACVMRGEVRLALSVSYWVAFNANSAKYALTSEHFSIVLGKEFSCKDIENFELEFLFALGWHIAPPTLRSYTYELLTVALPTPNMETLNKDCQRKIFENVDLHIKALINDKSILNKYSPVNKASAIILYVLDRQAIEYPHDSILQNLHMNFSNGLAQALPDDVSMSDIKTIKNILYSF